MVSKMLKAIAQMLEIEDGEEKDVFAKVKCARLMLQQIVEGLENKESQAISGIITEIPPTPSSKISPIKSPKPPPVEDEFPLDSDEVYEIKWDNTPEGKVLRGITNLDGNDFIELDGVKMKLKDALGKVMTKGVKVL